MHDVVVEMDGMELIGSQVVHVSSSRFEMKFDGVPIKVKFFTDGSGNRWEVGPDEDGVFSISLYNFKSRVGVGRLKPILAGKSENLSLYITFLVETLDAVSEERVVSFNFFSRAI